DQLPATSVGLDDSVNAGSWPLEADSRKLSYCRNLVSALATGQQVGSPDQHAESAVVPIGHRAHSAA
ncbi:MAG: hypothetical protein ACE5M4_14355, partial [Anaerolineales bacterium]